MKSGGPISQIHSPPLHVRAPGIILDLLRSVQMLTREWGAESNGKLPHLFISSKIATFVPEFAVEGLPLGRTAVLAPEFAVKYLPLGRTLWWWWWWWWLWGGGGDDNCRSAGVFDLMVSSSRHRVRKYSKLHSSSAQFSKPKSKEYKWQKIELNITWNKKTH